jgi:hypothetical protein
MSERENYRGSASDAQREYLMDLGYNIDRPLDSYTASRLISRLAAAGRQGPPTPRQERFLRLRERWQDGLTRAEATVLIGRILAEEDRRRC